MLTGGSEVSGLYPGQLATMARSPESGLAPAGGHSCALKLMACWRVISSTSTRCSSSTCTCCVMPRDGYAPREPSAPTGCSATANGTCGPFRVRFRQPTCSRRHLQACAWAGLVTSCNRVVPGTGRNFEMQCSSGSRRPSIVLTSGDSWRQHLLPWKSGACAVPGGGNACAFSRPRHARDTGLGDGWHPKAAATARPASSFPRCGACSCWPCC